MVSPRATRVRPQATPARSRPTALRPQATPAAPPGRATSPRPCALPGHGDRRGERAPGCDRGGALVGQLPLGALLPDAVEHPPVDRRRRRRHLRGPAPLGQRGADDLLLPRRRPGGQARVRPRRAARAAAPGDPDVRRASAAWRCPSRSTSRSTPAPRVRRTAGAPRCPPTPPSRSARWRCSRRARPRACACSC